MGLECGIIPPWLSSKSFPASWMLSHLSNVLTYMSSDHRTTMHCVALQETGGKTLLGMGLSYCISVPIHSFLSCTVRLSRNPANFRTPLPTGSLLGSPSSQESVEREGKEKFGGNELAPSCLLGAPVTMATVLHSISTRVCFEFPFSHSEPGSLIVSPSTPHRHPREGC